MQFTTIVLNLALASATVMAKPLVPRQSLSVGYGQQISTSTEANMWVAWVEGESACPAAQTLSALTESPCNILFTLENQQFQLGSCGSDNEPTELLAADGSFVHSCESDDDKITCHGDEHDIVKHGFCS
ncbi:hypothetical protein F4780DRAFT_782248 [Xylariomycetidae sp. FL0641]|nr:hypothetical protein F4780DRAFT_782248 [Xylariomycetidae sp. FL0641]